MNRVPKSSRQGFTIIELMLSMSFVSMLIVVILLTVVQMTKIYEKGISMREVNQVGRSIANDLTRTIGSSEPFDLGETDSFVQTFGPDGHPTSGRLCTGQTTYIWNISDSTENGEDVRFAKTYDPGKEYCIDGSKSVADDPNATDLLSGGERDLAMHGFTIQRFNTPDAITRQALYAVRFIIGVKDTSLLESTKASCKPPAESQGNEDYCAVNRFDLVIRAGNKELLSSEG